MLLHHKQDFAYSQFIFLLPSKLHSIAIYLKPSIEISFGCLFHLVESANECNEHQVGERRNQKVQMDYLHVLPVCLQKRAYTRISGTKIYTLCDKLRRTFDKTNVKTMRNKSKSS